MKSRRPSAPTSPSTWEIWKRTYPGRLGRKVKIAHKGKKGRIELEYYDDQDLEALLTLLQSLHREGGGGNG